MKSGQPIRRVSPPVCTALLLLLLLCFVAVAGGSFSNVTLSSTPPRGWNSYDSFSWIVSEEEFLQNAEYVAANLLKYGYEYVVVDFLWYRKHEPKATVTTPGYDIIDEWGRLVPDPVRWPSTGNGEGFKPIADKVHAMGLKFGIHVMRGISTAAVDSNTPILCAKDCPESTKGHHWMAKDIAVPGGGCSWMVDCFVKVNTSLEGGSAFINSLYQQYAQWGVDFIKHDCVFGVNDITIDEITAVGKAIEKTGRPMLYSLSPGVSATPEMGKQVAPLSHMYRITSDDWDTWSDVLSHFSVARDFAAAGLIGAPGLWGGKSWPDMDMLPIGWLTDAGASYGPYRSTSLTKDEQMTQITLWAMVKSPLMFGGDLRNIDQWTFALITQPIVLEINAHSFDNRELSSSLQSSLPDVALEDHRVSTTSTQWKLKSSKSGQDELCWSHFSRPRYSKGSQQALRSGCLNWRDLPGTLPYLNTESETSEGRTGHLWSSTSGEVCLESNGLSSNETDRNVRFSRCNGRSSQVWHLTSEGRLVNEEDGSCAVVKRSSNGWKVWVAHGSEGQNYVAFFNLGSQRTVISVALEDVVNHAKSQDLANAEDSIDNFATLMEWCGLNRVHRQVMSSFRWAHDNLGGRGRLMWWRSRWSCTGIEVWNNKTFDGNSLTTLDAWVEGHGTVLFELKCTPGTTQSAPILVWYFIALLCMSLMGLLGRYYDFAAKSLSFSYVRVSAEEATILEEEGSGAATSPLHAYANQKTMQNFAAL